MGPPTFMYFIRYVLPFVLFFLIIGIVAVIFNFTKLKFITKTDPNNSTKRVIDWSKFLPYFAVVCLVVGIIIWWFWKRFVRKWI